MLRVTFLDVGQGDAAIIEFPDNRVLVLDGGAAPPAGTIDFGRLAVSPALWHHGIHHVDTVALTHGHGDHAGGLGAVIDAFRPYRLVTGRLLDEDLPAACSVRSMAAGRGCRTVRLHRGMVLRRGDVDLVVLHPPPPGVPVVDIDDPNNRSLVLLLRHGRVRMLFAGDLETEGEALVLASPLARLARNCRVLKTGHHGAPDANGRRWLEHVSPDVAVVTAGRRNRFGHPDPALAGRLAAVGCRRFHQTGLDGALTVLSDGRDVLLRGAAAAR
jgi:competence protein ComEC